jgi:hypothetical protein
MSHDGDVSFLAAFPHQKHAESVHDEGSLIINRMEPGLFRKIFLQIFEENNFQKTPVSEFLILKRSLVFDINGSFLNEDWFLRNRMDDRETDPTKIMMLMPADWLSEAKTIRKVAERDARIKSRSEIRKTAEKVKFLPKPAPPIQTVNEMSSNFVTIDLFSPLQDKQTEETKEQFYEVSTEVNLSGYNNPANQGTLNFQESFGNCPISE